MKMRRCLLGVCILLLAGCAGKITREETLPTGAYRVSASRTIVSEKMDAGFSSSARSATILSEGTAVELLASEGSLGRIRFEGGDGYVFLRDIEPVPVPTTQELREKLRSSSHTPAADEPEAAPIPQPTPKPIDRKLIEETNDLEMPSAAPPIPPPIAE